MEKLVQLKDEEGNKTYPKNNRQMLTIECNDHRQDHTAWSSITITNMFVKDGDTTQLTLSGNGIRIGKGIDKVLVSACLQAGDTGTQNGDLTCELWKNNSNIGTGYNYKASTMYWVSTASPVLAVSVTEGDIIYLKLGGAITGSIRILNSYLSVVAIN